MLTKEASGGIARRLDSLKGVKAIEQLNIVGRRSGTGFIVHKARLVNALSRATADRVVINNVTLGRKGLLGYIQALGSSNVIKVIPADGRASESQPVEKRLKCSCGATTGYLEDGLWITDNTPVSICGLRVSPHNSIKPNLGATELSEALARVLPYAAKEDNRPVLQCVLFSAKDGKLTLVSADGYRLAVVSLDYDDGEGQALISRDDLKGMVSALTKARRVRLGFEDKPHGKGLVIDTELIRYQFLSWDGSYPEYEKLIPTEFHCTTHFDTVEAVKAVNTIKALSDSKAYPVDFNIGGGRIVISDPDDKGQAELAADTEGELKVRLDGNYLSQACKSFNGMVELRLTDGQSPVLFSLDGYRLVVMPMQTNNAKPEETPQNESQAIDKPVGPASAVAQAEKVVKQAKPKSKAKSKAKEPATVA